MNIKYNLSIIIPAYNSEKVIKDCLNKVINETKKIKSEIIVVDDCSTDKTSQILKKINKIRVVTLKRNKGVGNARNQGAKIAKYKNLCFIDSDIIISKNSILNLLKRFYKNQDIGSVSATQNTINLNQDSWSSNFVCLKSCYGTHTIIKEKEFSTISSEFCIISKALFNEVGKWKSLSGAGGEEFDLGYKIRKMNKKNIKLKNAGYSGYWCDLYERSKRIVHRTEKYIPILFKKKDFDSVGSFATIGQAISSILTFFIIIVLLAKLIFNFSLFVPIFTLLILIQLLIEIKFLIYSFKEHNLKMLLFSLYGIQMINLSIMLGGFLFAVKNTIGLPFKKRS